MIKNLIGAKKPCVIISGMKDFSRALQFFAWITFTALLFQPAPFSYAQIPAAPVFQVPLFYDCAGRSEALPEEKLSEIVDSFSAKAAKGNESAPALVSQALALHDQGKIEDALAMYNRALKTDAGFAPAYFGRAQVYEDLDDAAKAEADYTKGIELKPGEGMAYYRRAVLFEESGRYEKALADYSQAIRLSSAEACSHNNSGILLESMGRRDEALHQYNLAIQKDPSLDKAYLNRGYWHADSENFPQALADYNKAIALNPKDPLYYQVRAEVHTILGQHYEAADDLAAANLLASQ